MSAYNTLMNLTGGMQKKADTHWYWPFDNQDDDSNNKFVPFDEKITKAKEHAADVRDNQTPESSAADLKRIQKWTEDRQAASNVTKQQARWLNRLQSLPGNKHSESLGAILSASRDLGKDKLDLQNALVAGLGGLGNTMKVDDNYIDTAAAAMLALRNVNDLDPVAKDKLLAALKDPYNLNSKALFLDLAEGKGIDITPKKSPFDHSDISNKNSATLAGDWSDNNNFIGSDLVDSSYEQNKDQLLNLSTLPASLNNPAAYYDAVQQLLNENAELQSLKDFGLSANPSASAEGYSGIKSPDEILRDSKVKDTPWYSGALDWLKGDTSGIPNWLLAGGGTALAAWLANKMLSGGGNSMSAQEQMMYQLMMLQQQLEEERRARMAALSAPMRMMWEMPMGKFAAAKAMRAEDPTEGPVIPQRPTLNATSSLARLMEITHTRGLQNKDFGQRGMSSVKSAKALAESATDPSEGDNLLKRPTLTTGSSYKRLISMLSSKGQKNTSSNGLGMNSAENL